MTITHSNMAGIKTIIRALEDRINASNSWSEIECLWSLVEAVEDYETYERWLTDIDISFEQRSM